MLTTIKLKAKDRSCKAFFGFYFGLSFLEDVQQPLFIGAPGLARGGDDGRLVGELAADVDIERVVVAAELPAGRHVELVKRDGVAVQD